VIVSELAGQARRFGNGMPTLRAVAPASTGMIALKTRQQQQAPP
jgi:hypothetical protein